MAQILKRSNDFIFANISLLLFKDSSMEALFPSSFACLDCRSCHKRRCRYFIAARFIFMQGWGCLLCVVVGTSVTVLQTGCGQCDCGDAQEEMHRSPAQRPVQAGWKGELAQVSWPADSSAPVSNRLIHLLLDGKLAASTVTYLKMCE